MRNSKLVGIEGKGEITVKELTVVELDTLLGIGQDDYQATLLDRMLDQHNLTGGILAMSTGLKESDLVKMSPSEMKPLIDAFGVVNPDFLTMVRREMARAKEMQKALVKASESALAS